MAEHAADHHPVQQDISEQVLTFGAFTAMTKWGSLAIAALLLLLVMWFCTPAGFFSGAIAAAVLMVGGVLFLRDKPQDSH